MKKFILLIAFITSCLHITAKHYYELKGTVLIQNDNEPLIGALLKSLENPTINISTDFYGQYTLSLPEGKHIIECSYIGYETQQKVIELKANSILDFTLKEKPIELNDILIVHQFHPNKVYDAQVGTEEIGRASCRERVCQYV